MRLTRSVVTFVRLGRPHFLVGGFVMHALGVAAALWAGAELDLPTLLWTQAAITSTQLMVHYGNDYFDLEADRANTAVSAWSGGSRVLPAQLLPARVALLAAVFFGALGLACAFILGILVRPLPLALPLLALALALSWSYSGPPLRLQAHGWGLWVGTLVVSVLTPLLGFYMQAGAIAVTPLLPVIPVACLQAAMLVVVDLADAEGDALAGKRTFVVRMGVGPARALYGALLAAAYLTLPLLALAGVPWPVVAAAGLTAPLAAWLAWSGSRLGPELRNWNVPVFFTIALLVAVAALESAAYLWLVFG